MEAANGSSLDSLAPGHASITLSLCRPPALTQDSFRFQTACLACFFKKAITATHSLWLFIAFHMYNHSFSLQFFQCFFLLNKCS